MYRMYMIYIRVVLLNLGKIPTRKEHNFDHGHHRVCRVGNLRSHLWHFVFLQQHQYTKMATLHILHR